MIQIHTDGEKPQGENSENKHRRQTETSIDRIDTVAYVIKEFFGYEKSGLFYRPNLEPNKGYTQADAGTVHKPQDFLPENMMLPGTS